MRPTIEELQKFWLLAYSRSSLLDAHAFLKGIDTAMPGSLGLRAMIDAAVVAYARPFTKFQLTREERVAPLADVPPPTHLAEFHQDALDLRNKMIGHKDATPAPRHRTTPNIVQLKIDSQGFYLHTTIIREMGSETRNALKELCAYYVKYCEENLRPLTRGYFSEVMEYPPGEYELVMSESPADWIRPFRPEDFRE
jgi:hypothetical protein